MATNIFHHEFKTYLRSVITWSLAISAVIFIFESLFSSFATQAEILNETMANFPPQLLAAFGLNGTDLSTVLGFFSFIFLFVQICLAIQAAGYGFSLVSVEEREWTADFLLTRPVTRTRILNSKLLAAFCCLAITNLAIWIASFGCISLFKGDRAYDAGSLSLLLASIVIFQLFFFCVGLVISLIVKRIRSVMPYSMGLAFGMYVLGVFGDMLGTSFLEDITPFKHFDPNYIIQNGHFDFPLTLVSVAVVVISVAGSYVLYTKRDIPGVS
jgi:ABC-2 type transport system permease protein